MNKEEAIEYFQDVPLAFVGYNKYKFTYTDIKDDNNVLVIYGGDSDDIYITEFLPIEKFTENSDDFEYFGVSQDGRDELMPKYVFSES